LSRYELHLQIEIKRAHKRHIQNVGR
jgi:hypothetical protein